MSEITARVRIDVINQTIASILSTLQHINETDSEILKSVVMLDQRISEIEENLEKRTAVRFCKCGHDWIG